MVREFSAGGVVLRRMRGRWFIAVIEPQVKRPKKTAHSGSSRKPAAEAGVLALPKGAIDAGEKPAETAIREVQEETGLQATLVTKLADVKYMYVRNWGDRARVFKVVSFYLLLYHSGRLGNICPEMRIEVQDTHWLPLESALEKLSYRGERDVAAAALKYLEAHPQLGTYAPDTTR